MSTHGLASDASWSRCKTDQPSSGCTAGSVDGVLQRRVSDGASGVAPHNATARNPKKGGDGSPQRPSSDILSEVENRVSVLENTERNVPRFLIVKRAEGDFSSVSPFLIDKVLTGLIGQVNSVRKINEGLLIEAKTTNQARKLLEVKKFYEFDVTVTPHNSLNYTKGVITCRDLLNCSIVEISENLAEQGVIEVKRIMMMREGKRVESASLILTFNRDTLPKKVKAGFHSITVRPYIPAPLRCYKCQKFGHTSVRCNEKEVCICGKEPHPESACAEPLKCINCQGSHSARSRDCPTFKEEMAIQKIKTLEKISFNEARRKVKDTIIRPVSNISYAQATTSSLSSLSVNENVVKDIVKNLVPEIVQICTSILNDTLHKRTEVTEAKRPKEKRPLSADPPTSGEKRKCSEQGNNSDNESLIDHDMSATDESGTQDSEFVLPRTKKKKPGWQKGRPRKSKE